MTQYGCRGFAVTPLGQAYEGMTVADSVKVSIEDGNATGVGGPASHPPGLRGTPCASYLSVYQLYKDV